MSTLDRLTLSPALRASGQINLPGSKSISNRVLLLSALCTGTTLIDGVLRSDDTRVMLQALETLGVTIEHSSQCSVRITSSGIFTNKKATLFLGNAGTAFRPLTAALAFAGGDYDLSGVSRMHERPIGDLVEALVALGARIDYVGQAGYPPLAIGASKALGNRVHVNGSVSSQFLTALLIASPLIVAQSGQDLTIAVMGTLISEPYINITINLMARFGVQVTTLEDAAGNLSYHIDQKAQYTSPGKIAVEGDASSASYFLALGLIGQGPVCVQGVDHHSIQGDVRFVDTLTLMGATATYGFQTITVSGRSVVNGERLHAFDQDFNLIPDAAMTAAVLAIYADGPCTLRNIGSWRVKETDRIDAMVTELRKLGAEVSSGDDWLTVHPIASSAWQPAAIQTYDDHRIAMCFSLAAFGPVPVTIEDPGCVAKTFPDYFEQYHRLIS